MSQQQDDWSPGELLTIRTRIEDFGSLDIEPVEQGYELGDVGPEHRVDWVVMVGVAVRYGHQESSTFCHQGSKPRRERGGVGYVLENIAA